MDSTVGRLHDPAEKPFDDVVGIAVVVKLVDAAQHHVGILYKDLDDAEPRAKVLDLQWHHIVVTELAHPRHGYFWVEPEMEPERAYLLAKLCERIAERHAGKKPSIAYALKYWGGRFGDDGVFVSEGGLGLTCATFVMAVFASRGSPLVDWHDWRVREEEDRAWLDHVVEMLRHKSRATKEHIDAVNQEAKKGCARFRPEEVAAAGVACELPVGFGYAERIGKQIVARLAARGRS